MAWITKWIKQQNSSKALVLVLCCSLALGLALPSFATPVSDSSKGILPSINTSTGTSSSSGGCNYNAQDTYGSTELPSQGFSEAYLKWGIGWVNYPIVNGNYNLTWSGGANSSLTTPVPCTGVYQVVFSIQFQATNGGGAINISPCVKTTDGITTIYGTCPAAAGSPQTFSFNPFCNGGFYCGVMTYPFAAQVTLTQGQMVAPPSIFTNGQINVTGGEFLVYYVGP